MAETQVFPDFHQELTRERGEGALPEIGPEEMALAATAFNHTFDNWARTFEDGFRLGQNNEGRVVAQLLQRIEAQDKTYILAVMEVGERPQGGVEAANDLRPSEDIRRVINLQLLVGDQPSDLSSYRFCVDGIVRRYDVDAEVNHMRKMMTSMDLQSATTEQELQQKYQATDQNYKDNVRFEEDMGVNNQPVSLEEIEGLGQFLGDLLQPGPPQAPPARPPRSEEPSPYI